MRDLWDCNAPVLPDPIHLPLKNIAHSTDSRRNEPARKSDRETACRLPKRKAALQPSKSSARSNVLVGVSFQVTQIDYSNRPSAAPESKEMSAPRNR